MGVHYDNRPCLKDLRLEGQAMSTCMQEEGFTDVGRSLVGNEETSLDHPIHRLSLKTGSDDRLHAIQEATHAAARA